MPEDNESYDEMGDSRSEADAADMAHLLQSNEEKIISASIKAIKSGTLTPLVKEELRFTIQSRRLAAGKSELKLEEFKKPPKKKPMTDEERKRAQVRRLQNREAAQRFRQRQKDQASYLTEKIKRLEKTSCSLLEDMKRLREEKEELTTMLHNHLAICTNNIPVTDSMGANLAQTLQHYAPACSSSDSLTINTPDCALTSDSTSSAFLPDEVVCDQNGGVIYGGLFRDLDISTIEIIQDNGSMMMMDLMDGPELGEEMTIGDPDLSDSVSEHSHETRHDSCSSLDTTFSLSGEGYSLTDSNHELSSSLAATVSLVHMNHVDVHHFDSSFITDDIFLDNMTS